MKLKNPKTGQVINLPYDLYPIDDLNWSKVVSKTEYLLDGSLDIQQSVKQAGKPVTLQSADDLGLVTRQTVNELHRFCELPETTFEMSYDKDGQTHTQTVVFDHSQQPIQARPAKDFNSPDLNDYFSVVLKFLVV